MLVAKDHPTGIQQDLGPHFLLIQWGNKYIAFDNVKTKQQFEILLKFAQEKLGKLK